MLIENIRYTSRVTGDLVIVFEALEHIVDLLFLVLRFSMLFIPIQVFSHIIYVGLEIFTEILLFTNSC